MTDLSDLIANMDAVRSGVWITVGSEPNTFEIRTRGITNAYRDGLNALKRDAAREANRQLRPGQVRYDADSLPPTLDDWCQGRALVDHCFLDVRGLTMNGAPVTAEQFSDMLLASEGKTLLLGYAIGAAFRVADETKAEKEKVEGNSSLVSASA